jgi:hypothetical protein
MNEITIRQLIKSLRENSPGFSLVLDRIMDKYGDDREIDWHTSVEEYGGIYTVFNELARYLDGLLENNQTDEIKEILRLVEAWHTNGDERVQQAVTVGLLEDLVSLNPDHKLQDEPFFAYMGNETKYWAQQVKGFWRDGTVISDHRKHDD